MQKQKKTEMKKRIRKTGEVVNIIVYSNIRGSDRDDTDFVHYIDSKGVEYYESRLNMCLDFEDVEENEASENIDWEQRRYETSRSCINGILANEEMTHMAIDAGLKKECRDIPSNIVKMAVAFADALIAELKEGGGR